MPDKINFQQQINDSVDIGDILYFVNIDANGNATTTEPNQIGVITNIGDNFVEVDTGLAPQNLTNQDIEDGTISPVFLFRKNNQVNVSTLVGYFANVLLSNDSINQSELFSVGSEIFASSK